MKREKKFVITVIIGTLILLTLGCMLDFHPFLGDDLIVREVQWCTLLVCAVIAICAYMVIDSRKK